MAPDDFRRRRLVGGAPLRQFLRRTGRAFPVICGVTPRHINEQDKNHRFTPRGNRIRRFPSMSRPLFRKGNTTMRKASIAALAAAAIAITGAGVLAATGSGIAAPATGPAADPNPTAATQHNAAIEWNQALLDITGAPTAPGAAPSTVQPTRNFAILALAIDSAVNAIDHTHQPTTGEPTADPGASAPAAAASAAHDALVALYPAHGADLDTRLTSDLATLPSDNATQQGILVGQAAARMILDSRAHDGADSPPPPHVADPAPGRYQPTPPASAPPVFTGWGHVMPFVLHSGDQFRPAPPPAID